MLCLDQRMCIRIPAFCEYITFEGTNGMGFLHPITMDQSTHFLWWRWFEPFDSDSVFVVSNKHKICLSSCMLYTIHDLIDCWTWQGERDTTIDGDSLHDYTIGLLLRYYIAVHLEQPSPKRLGSDTSPKRTRSLDWCGFVDITHITPSNWQTIHCQTTFVLIINLLQTIDSI